MRSSTQRASAALRRRPALAAAQRFLRAVGKRRPHDADRPMVAKRRVHEFTRRLRAEHSRYHGAAAAGRFIARRAYFRQEWSVDGTSEQVVGGQEADDAPLQADCDLGEGLIVQHVGAGRLEVRVHLRDISRHGDEPARCPDERSELFRRTEQEALRCVHHSASAGDCERRRSNEPHPLAHCRAPALRSSLARRGADRRNGRSRRSARGQGRLQDVGGSCVTTVGGAERLRRVFGAPRTRTHAGADWQADCAYFILN